MFRPWVLAIFRLFTTYRSASCTMCVGFILGGRDLVLQYWGAWPCNALDKCLNNHSVSTRPITTMFSAHL